jgi:hypothetical protein
VRIAGSADFKPVQAGTLTEAVETFVWRECDLDDGDEYDIEVEVDGVVRSFEVVVEAEVTLYVDECPEPDPQQAESPHRESATPSPLPANDEHDQPVDDRCERCPNEIANGEPCLGDCAVCFGRPCSHSEDEER